ncbi:major facilitator superfamily domain-containing protein [Phyllosticta citrichinensis]|uniref:Major facilitator superfamily domain-containing protein n=1 Tax=Phyllosticta citrichinensis TaxID=1130410 RepID=A0ABR1XPC8_9PEZI
MSRRPPSSASSTSSSSPSAIATPPSLSASTGQITSRDPVSAFDVSWSDRLNRHEEIEMATFDDNDGAAADDEEDDDGDEEEKGFLGGRGGSGADGARTGGLDAAVRAGASGPPAEDFELFTPDEERRVRRKLDRRLVLFMGLLYLLSFLDRSNIGNARIAGLERDLKLQNGRYEWLLTAFYVTYIAFEWMTLMYRLVPPHMYIAACVFSWGLIASLQSLSTSFGQLVALRALLGVAEAAFGPGVPFYLSHFFRRDELAFRTGLFVSAAPLSTSFASSLAWAIMWAGDKLGLKVASWRLLFLVEGLPSCLVALWAWRLVPDGPGEARWLSRREREVAVLRLRREGEEASAPDKEDESDAGAVAARAGRRSRAGIDWRQVRQTLTDPKCYLTAAMFFLSNVAFSSIPVYLPTIIHGMGHSVLTSQALAAPPYLLAFLFILLTSHFSDRQRARAPFLVWHALLAAFGFATLALAAYYGTHDFPSFRGRAGARSLHALRYAAVYPAAVGFFGCVTLVIAWTINNQRGATGRGTGVALLNVVGQCGPLVGTRLFPDADAPWFMRGFGVCAGAMAGVAVLALGLRWWLRRENERMVKEREGWEGGGVEEVLLRGGERERKGAWLYML